MSEGRKRLSDEVQLANDAKQWVEAIQEYANGDLKGASKLITGSLEYQYNVTGKWWGAVFVDSGEAVSDIRRSDFKTGAGVGVRWESPVGPIKLDFAVPVADKDEHGLQFYIGLGPEL